MCSSDLIENTRVYYDGPILAFTGELDPTLSGLAGYKIEMIYAQREERRLQECRTRPILYTVV